MSTSTRIAHAIVRLYPRRWRARYETELLALIEDTGVTSRTILDLLWSAGREWVRAAARRPSPTPAVLGPKEPPVMDSPGSDLKFGVFGAGIALGTLAMAHAVQPHVAIPNDWLSYSAYAVMFASLARSMVVGLVYRRPERQLAWAMSSREIAWWTPMLIAAFLVTDLDALAPSTWHPRLSLPLWISTSLNGVGAFGCFEFATKRAVAWRQYVRRQRQAAVMKPPIGFTSGL